MKLLPVTQGTTEWHAARAAHDCASDAPAMMGASKRCTRTDLVRMRATGDEKVFSAWAEEHLLARGHEVEAFGRSHVEAAIGEDLYPAVAASDAGDLLASFDGLTMDEETAVEVKLWNEELAAAVRAKSNDLPGGHHWQLEQQLAVGAKRVIFVVTDGTPEKCVDMVYNAVPGRREQLMAGWKQFGEDVKNYQHVETAPKPVAATMLALPMPSLSVIGTAEVAESNLTVYGDQLRAFIARLPTKPATDQEFADADAAVKALKAAEDALDAASTNLLAKFADIDTVRRELAQYGTLARDTRLALNKLVESRKAAIRSEIRQEGLDAIAKHVAALNVRLGRPLMPVIQEAFAEKMKGLKGVDSLRNAMNTEVARLKIEASGIADRIHINLELIAADAKEHVFLFHDLAQIVLKANDDFAALVRSRIVDHKESEAKKAEAMREQIRKEEEAKAQAAAAPAPQPAPASIPTSSAARGGGKSKRPTDSEIVTVVAAHYGVAESIALGWLRAMEIRKAA